MVESTARPFPARSRAPVVIRTVYRVSGLSVLVGAKTAFTPEYITDPGTTTPPVVNRNVDAVRVSGSIGSLNVAPTWVLIGTPVAPFALMVAITRGGIVSGRAPVVNVHANAVSSALPARSRAAVVIVAV